MSKDKKEKSSDSVLRRLIGEIKVTKSGAHLLSLKEQILHYLEGGEE